jgi:hypothetical protein
VKRRIIGLHNPDGAEGKEMALGRGNGAVTAVHPKFATVVRLGHARTVGRLTPQHRSFRVFVRQPDAQQATIACGINPDEIAWQSERTVRSRSIALTPTLPT